MTSGISFSSVQTASAHRLADAVHPFGKIHTVFGSEIQTEALSCLNRTTMLTHDPFEVGFGRSSCVRPTRLVYQHLNRTSFGHSWDWLNVGYRNSHLGDRSTLPFLWASLELVAARGNFDMRCANLVSVGSFMY